MTDNTNQPLIYSSVWILRQEVRPVALSFRFDCEVDFGVVAVGKQRCKQASKHACRRSMLCQDPPEQNSLFVFVRRAYYLGYPSHGEGGKRVSTFYSRPFNFGLGFMSFFAKSLSFR